jgi:NADH-quinone oxidoreductase subunit G
MAAAAQIATALVSARQPLLIVSAIDNELLKAAANIAQMLSERKAQPCLLSIVVPECNSMGAAILGGINLDEVLEEIEAGEADGMLVLENDLFRHISPDKVNRALTKLRHLIVLEHTPNSTTAAADLILPAATFAESMGTMINNEGRAQHFYQVFVPAGEPRQSWQILRDLIKTKNSGKVDWRVCEDVTRVLAEANPAFNAIQENTPAYSWREPAGDPLRGGAKGKRLWENGAGYLAVFFPADPEAPLNSGEFWLAPRPAIFGSEELSRVAPGIASIMPAPLIRLHPDDAAKLSVAEGDMLSFAIDATTYTLPVKLDAGVAKNVAIIPAGYQETAGIVGIPRARIEKSP